MKKANEFKVNDVVSKTINYKEIEITKYNGYWNCTVFDTERLVNSYNYNFKKFKDAKECFYQLIDIQLEKMNFQF